MPIIFHEESREFHLYNESISYVLCILENGHMGHLYMGRRLDEYASYGYLNSQSYRPLTSYHSEEGSLFSLQYARQEYACYGTGDPAQPAFILRHEDGSKFSDFQYQSHQIVSGKPKLPGLPATYANEEEDVTSLFITLYDAVSQTELVLLYHLFEKLPVLTRSVRFHQLGENTVYIERALSMNLDLADDQYQWIHLDGAWGRERHVKESPLHQGIQSIYSLKGSSSAEHNPFLALKRPHADEHQGEVLGFSLVYSGNFLAQADVTPFRQARVSLGIHPDTFCWKLEKQESFQTPEVVIAYSCQGLNGLSQTYHHLYHQHLIRGYWKNRERPVLLNGWEAITFDFDEEKIMNLATEAARVGVEVFVMDDGWFGNRNHERAGLGDWTVNSQKLPHGLTGLIDAVHGLGMKFGLWIEPEMVNRDSHFFREHPDWILHHPERSVSHGRYQYVLNLVEDSVFQNIYNQISHLLRNHQIDYIKWDSNRYLTEVYSHFLPANQQGELFHRYTLRLYQLYESLTKEFPHVLFESCSSGGGRFDPGMLYYAPQTWTSDDSDAIERLYIQYGTSLVYPLSSMGCHVSDVPNHQVGRVTPLSTRGRVAYFGNLGYELDLTQIKPEEKVAIAKQIAYYKKYRDVFQYGNFTRLVSPFEEGAAAWQVSAQDGSQIFVGYYQILSTVNQRIRRIYLKDLKEKATYRLADGRRYQGSSLMYAGLPLDDLDEKDFSSLLFHLVKEEE